MLEPYRPEFFAQVESFARRQPEFDYLKGIIKAHSEDGAPGRVWVWTEPEARGFEESGVQGVRRVVAICGLAWLNRDDAWLYGMRVDPEYKGRGIATKFTRELFRVAAGSGRTWVGLDTLNHPRKAPVFRITEKLGMKLEGIYTTTGFWNMPARFRARPLNRARDIFASWQAQARPVMFHQRFQSWVWSRIQRRRKRLINRDGLVLCGTLVHVMRDITRDENGRRVVRTSANLLVEPKNWKEVLSVLLGYASGKGRRLVVNYPVEWESGLLSAARELVPKLKRNRNFFSVSWRIYGKIPSRRRR